MTKYTSVLFVVGLLGCSLAVACKSSSSSGSTKGTGGSTTSTGSSSGGSGFSCDFMAGGVHECAEYDNLPAADVTAEKSACTAEGGTAGSSCSSTGRVGQCAQSAGGISYKTSYYSGTSATDKSACTAGGGTWTDG